MAPELIPHPIHDLDRLFRPVYSTKSDVYAFSMVSYVVYPYFSRKNSRVDPFG